MENPINFGGEKSLIRIDMEPKLETEVSIPESSFEALKIWKARPGELITLIDLENRYYRARLTRWDGLSAAAHIFNRYPDSHESKTEISVFQALPEKERFELILQKLTEIGVKKIIPFVSAKSITLEERESGQRKSHKWPDTIIRASKQCRRAMIPELGEIMTWENIMDNIQNYPKAIILSEHNEGITLRQALANNDSDRVCIITGPEGGFTKNEISVAIKKGITPVSLGSRILRTETASIVAAAIAVYATDGFS